MWILSVINTGGLCKLIAKQVNGFHDWQRRRLERRHGRKNNMPARIGLCNFNEGCSRQTHDQHLMKRTAGKMLYICKFWPILMRTSSLVPFPLNFMKCIFHPMQVKLTMDSAHHTIYFTWLPFWTFRLNVDWPSWIINFADVLDGLDKSLLLWK